MLIISEKNPILKMSRVSEAKMSHEVLPLKASFSIEWNNQMYFGKRKAKMVHIGW